jgi:trehalose 6-phosphate synthase
VGIDVAQWEAYRRDPVVDALSRLHVRGGGCLAVGVDRLDYTKGVMPKLLALEVLFSSGRVRPDELRLVQIASPTRQHVPSYAFLAHDVAEAVRRINAAFPRADGVPVVELYEEQWTAREVAGLMRAADIALVTPVRDGMNLVAVEHAVVNADRASDLVLGAGAGVAEHLGAWSDVVDGRDVLGMADVLHQLVRSPRPDRVERAEARGRAAARLRSDVWAHSCLAALEGDLSTPTAAPAC